MRKIASLLPVLMLLCTLAFAQTRTVKGIVRDDKGDPISFATITEAGTKMLQSPIRPARFQSPSREVQN
jgi:hypothetical protein